MVTARGRQPASDEQYHVNSPPVDKQCHDAVNSPMTRVTVPALGTVPRLGLVEAEKNLGSDYHVSREGLS
jgi:hypothetical protein